MLSDNIELGGLWGVGDMLGCLCVDVSFLANDRACNDVHRRLQVCLEFFRYLYYDEHCVSARDN